MSAPWATKTRASIPGAAPISATSSSSRTTFPKRRSFAWSRTTARPRTSCKLHRRWSRATRSAKERICGPIAAAGTQIGYYEAPDGENEALFAADYIAKYLRQNQAENGETPRAAVLYRTNSQSRLMEEAMRRYQMKYHVVGGFSFYERAEIKDMISYLKVIANPDDSIAMQRVINNPPRGLGKTTMETIERIALETGTSMWGAINETVRQQLLPPRALSALQ